MRKFFIGLLGFFLLIALVPSIVIPIMMQQTWESYFPASSRHSWSDFRELEDKIGDPEANLVAYYGVSACPACASLTKLLVQSEDIRNKIAEIESSLNFTVEQELLQFWYEWNKDVKLLRSDERFSFDTSLRSLPGFDSSKLDGTPHWIIIRGGQIVDQFTPSANKEQDIIDKLDSNFLSDN